MVGSFVRVSGNGLGCPDWPLCYGRAVPPMEIGAWVEFGHRLVGGLVGIQIGTLSVLAIIIYRNEKWILRPAVLVGFLLLIQVSLGGIHVLNELPLWSGLVHTAVAMAIVGLLATIVAATQPRFQDLGNLKIDLLFNTAYPYYLTIGTVATYLLLLTGSLVTRTGSSLACPSFPHCGLAEISEQLQPFVTIQMIHRFTAFIVAATILIRRAKRFSFALKVV